MWCGNVEWKCHFLTCFSSSVFVSKMYPKFVTQKKCFRHNSLSMWWCGNVISWLTLVPLFSTVECPWTQQASSALEIVVATPFPEVGVCEWVDEWESKNASEFTYVQWIKGKPLYKGHQSQYYFRTTEKRTTSYKIPMLNIVNNITILALSPTRGISHNNMWSMEDQTCCYDAQLPWQPD